MLYKNKSNIDKRACDIDAGSWNNESGSIKKVNPQKAIEGYLNYLKKKAAL